MVAFPAEVPNPPQPVGDRPDPARRVGGHHDEEAKAYLVDVTPPQQAARVYAVVTETVEEALARVQVLVEKGAGVALAGGMAPDMVRRLKPGRPRQL